MHSLPKNVQKLIDHFVRLPGIGSKTASRLVLFLLHSSTDNVIDFSRSLLDMKEKVGFCANCYNLAEGELCAICEEPSRVQDQIIIVEDILDLLAFENIGEFKGLYHVLGGLINPMQGIGPEDLNIGGLLSRIKKRKDLENLELIIATNPSMEGEATAMYLKGELDRIYKGINISRIARGLPTGADLDYADKVTLLRSFEGRVGL